MSFLISITLPELTRDEPSFRLDSVRVVAVFGVSRDPLRVAFARANWGPIAAVARGVGASSLDCRSLSDHSFPKHIWEIAYRNTA